MLNIALEEVAGARPINLGLAAGFGYQVNANIYAEANTTLANIEIADSATAIFGSDFIPLNLAGYYSMDNTMDVGAGVNFMDLKEAGDTWGIMVMARKFLGVN